FPPRLAHDAIFCSGSANVGSSFAALMNNGTAVWQSSLLNATMPSRNAFSISALLPAGFTFSPSGFTVLSGGFTVLSGGFTVLSGGLTVLSGGFTVLSGGFTVLSGGFTVLSGGLMPFSTTTG